MGNPKFNIQEAICMAAHYAGVPIIVDNTFGSGK
jgi:O-acetylhomoserine/O-acetylserine sulfhydrylase-like pyridoxal-dependent enzyme